MIWSLAIVPILAGGLVFFGGARSRLALGLWAAVALALVIALSVLAAQAGWTGRIEWARPLYLTADLTRLSAAMAILVPVIALPVALYAVGHEEERGLARLIALLLAFVGGMELLVIAADLLTLLIGWELVGACSWALIGHHWRDAANPRSGAYAFLATRLGDLGMFAAAMALFAGAGAFDYAAIGGLEAPYLQIVAFGLLLSAAAKSGQLPFAPWLFRAMDGPTSVSALLHAATMVAAGAYLLIRLHPYLGGVPGFAGAAIGIGLATALAGGLVALLQSHAKKLLAASTSAHYGLMFVAVGAGYPGIALLHLAAHAGFKALLFLAAGAAGERVESFELDRMRLGRALPFVALLSAAGALALAGVPPLGGAWTKEAVTSAAGHHALWAAAGIMVAGGLSAAYATRFQLLSYGTADDSSGAEAPAPAVYAGMVLLALLTLAASALWLPAIRDGLRALLAIEIPQTKTAELVASLLLIALGLLAGRYLAQRHPLLGTGGTSAAAAEWLGLPSLIRRSVTQPFVRLARSAAWLDDRVLDAVPEAAAQGAVRLARLASSGDGRVVDRGIELTAALSVWTARVADRIGERVSDGFPEGAARLVSMTGRDAGHLQTGLSHHYYALLIGGSALLILILMLA